MAQIRGRFAPSPTGLMHLGNVWTALLSWLSVRAKGGCWVLRIEDLDQERSKHVFAEQLQADLKWLGLIFDEGPFWQSRRQQVYEQALDQLRQANLVYPCYCTRAELRQMASAPHLGQVESVYSGKCRTLTLTQREELESQGRRQAWRIKATNQTIQFRDGLYGPFEQDLAREVGDFVIQRSDGVIAYQLAVVIDDAAMNITEVLRGRDLLESTPRQIFLYNQLGFKAPQFTHVPLLLGEDGHRLSKRHGDLTIAALRSKGIKAEQIIGFLAYAAGLTEVYEPFRADELVACFALQKLKPRDITIPQGLAEQL